MGSKLTMIHTYETLRGQDHCLLKCKNVVMLREKAKARVLCGNKAE